MMMKKLLLLFAMFLLPLVACAYEFEVANADGITIYYNYINNGTELEVTYYPQHSKDYQGNVAIPEEVTYMNRTRKVTSIGKEAFYRCYRLTSVTIPNSVTIIGEQAFLDCDGLTSITIPNRVTSIEDYAFSKCSGLTSVTIPNSVTTIGSGAFDNCSKLASLTIGNSVTSIGDAAFHNCQGLTSITIPNSVTSIGEKAFEYCSGLTSVTIPNSVTTIGSGAFANCSKLASLTIGSSVTSIGYWAFVGADIPIVVSLIRDPFKIEGKTAYFCTFSPNTFNNATLYVPVGTIEKYKATEGWKDFLFIEEGNPTGTNDDEKKAYAVLKDNNTVLSFYYDDQKAARNGMDVGPFYSYDSPLWYGQKETITSVVFDASFANCTTLTSTAYWFYLLQNLSSITGISNLKTDNVTDMSSMFLSCSGLTNLDVSGFKTDNVTNMRYMFWGCSGLTSLDVSGFKTDNVTNMECMFYGCSNLTSLDVTGFKTDNVTNMQDMFSGCSNLTSLDVSGFKTDNVTNMRYMFSGCSGLTSLDVSGFKTDNVTNMESMFRSCSNLTSLDVSGFKTDNVTDMFGMFEDCSGLKNLDVTGFKTDNVTDMGWLFSGCSSLTSLDVTGFKTDNVTNMGGVFDGCSGLKNLDVTRFKTDNVTNMYRMFWDCSGLTSLDVTGFKTDNVTIMGFMFSGCSGLKNLDVTGFKTDNVTDMLGMFSGCSKLTSLDVTGFKTDNVTIMKNMFSGCSGLKTIYAGDGWSTAKVQYGGSMFTDCTSLVGGAGTTFNAIHTDYTYARIDGGSSNPGYFTSKGATPVEEDVDEITIKDIGKTTWCSKYDLDFTNVEGIKAYIAIGYDDIDKTIWLARVMKVPAGTGILVKGDAGTYKIPHAKVQSAYANWFVGNVGETISIAETDGDKTNYYLSGKDGTFVSVNGNANIGKNKAYLQLPTSVFAGTRSIGISYDDEDGTTSIKGVKTGDMKSGEWYTLQGQRVVKPGKGLYIHNGKKVVIK